jgi:hypothetical protein
VPGKHGRVVENKDGSAQGISYRDCPGGLCRGRVAYEGEVRRLISVWLARAKRLDVAPWA